MKKLNSIIAQLTEVEDGKYVYSLNEARWLRAFKCKNPAYIELIYSIESGAQSPYFKATLTDKGRDYLRGLSYTFKEQKETV